MAVSAIAASAGCHTVLYFMAFKRQGIRAGRSSANAQLSCLWKVVNQELVAAAVADVVTCSWGAVERVLHAVLRDMRHASCIVRPVTC